MRLNDITERLRDLHSATADEAASLIRALRTVNDEVFAASIKSVRDTAELAIELREVKAERVKLATQLDEYRECFASLSLERDGLWEDLERVTKERDEARRECCTWQGLESGRSKQDVAIARGWDCFANADGASASEIPDDSREAP